MNAKTEPTALDPRQILNVLVRRKVLLIAPWGGALAIGLVAIPVAGTTMTSPGASGGSVCSVPLRSAVPRSAVVCPRPGPSRRTIRMRFRSAFACGPPARLMTSMRPGIVSKP